jgi:zona occludens toxin (predicted ATPase)
VALIVVTGSPGSGKSSSAIEDFILPALVAGRPVVTNIEGMKDPERQLRLRAICEAKAGKELPFAFTCIGHSELEGGNVFPRLTGTEDEHGTRQWDQSAALAPFGTVLVWDEADAFETKNLGKSWEVALRMHRHWASETSPFDIVLLHQNWKSLAPIVRANAAEVYEYVPHPDDKKRLCYIYKSPGDRELPRKAKDTLREVRPRNLAVRETYKSTVVNAGVKDNVAKHFWQTDYFKRMRTLIVILLLVGGVASCAAVSWLKKQYGVGSPAKPALASGAAAAPGGAPGSAAPAASAPSIVGMVPTATGLRVLVKDGDAYQLVEPVGRKVTFNGKDVPWPADF